MRVADVKMGGQSTLLARGNRGLPQRHGPQFASTAMPCAKDDFHFGLPCCPDSGRLFAHRLRQLGADNGQSSGRVPIDPTASGRPSLDLCSTALQPLAPCITLGAK